MRALAMTGIETVSMIESIMSGSLIRLTPPWARMSAGTRSRAMTATAPASSAILACSAVVTTSMITPPLSMSAMPRLTRVVPVPVVSDGVPAVSAMGRILRPFTCPTHSTRGSSHLGECLLAHDPDPLHHGDRAGHGEGHSTTCSRIGASKIALSPVITRMATRRSARSAMPTFAVKPRPSALARA